MRILHKTILPDHDSERHLIEEMPMHTVFQNSH